MRKGILTLALCITLGLLAAPGHAQLNNLGEPGSLLAYPLIDNIHFSTIVNIANTGTDPAVLECYVVTYGLGGSIDEKKDVIIKLTPHEEFVWMSSKPYNQGGNLIQGFNGRRGYMFCYAIDNINDRLEIHYDSLKGSAILTHPGSASAFAYSAIPHQGIAVTGDRVLNLNGVEYTEATSQILFEGLAAVPGAIEGILAVASPGIDFMSATQPAFDFTLFCWNEVESKFSRQVMFKDFAHYDMAVDLQLDIGSVVTLGWQCESKSDYPLWAVFQQDFAGFLGWGGNVFQYRGAGVAAAIVLPIGNNIPPVAVNDDVTTSEDTALSGNVLIDNGNGADGDFEGDALSVTAVNGSAADVSRPTRTASGTLLTLNGDGNGGFATATVTVTIKGRKGRWHSDGSN